MSLYAYKECDCDPPWPACNHLHRKDDRPATPTDILAAVRDLGYLVMRGVTCETCDGELLVPANAPPYIVVKGEKLTQCSTCKALGLVLSPEAIEAAATILDGAFDVPPITAKIMAKSALMAAVDTEKPDDD